jgi:hypothetical protein
VLKHCNKTTLKGMKFQGVSTTTEEAAASIEEQINAISIISESSSKLNELANILVDKVRTFKV